MEQQNVFKAMESDINGSSKIPETEKLKFLKKLHGLKNQKINIMITGATGCGKSSTINALFDCEKAKVGMGVDPETMDIARYELDNLVLWDSPGLGDGKEADNRHSKNIINKLYEKDEYGNALIDLVLVILDGSSRDLGTSYELINQVIIPNLGEDKKNRILVAINQADVAMKGRFWNHDKNRPEPKLESFLDEKAISVKKRIKEATGVDIEPVYYSAGYQDDGMQQRPYNLSKLLYFIVSHTPGKKRLAYINNLSNNENMWKDNDQLKDYSKEVQQSFMETVRDYATDGGEIGREIGEAIGMGSAGKVIGKVVGGAVGAIKSVFSSISSWF